MTLLRQPLPPARRAATLALCLSGLVVGCGGAQRPSTHPSATHADAASTLPEAQFVPKLLQLIASEPTDPARPELLRQVLGRQMARTAELLEAREPQRARRVFAGALLLLRRDELTPERLGPHAPAALRGLAREAAQRGDEGESRALYSMLKGVGAESERKDAEEHLRALEAWSQRQLTNRPKVSGLALRAVSELAEHRVDLRSESQQRAEASQLAWIAAATRARMQPPSEAAGPVREERIDTFRALTSAPLQLVALRLRHLDAEGTLRLMRNLRSQASFGADLQALIEHLVENPSSEAWGTLARVLRTTIEQQQARSQDEYNEAQELMLDAAFVAALEAYRLAPDDMRAALQLAMQLPERGLLEAVPSVMATALPADAEPEALQWAVRATNLAMEQAQEQEPVTVLRRMFEASAPWRTRAEALGFQLEPPALALQATLARAELRAGEVARAKPLLLEEVKRAPLVQTELLLAELERQAGDGTAAEQRLEAALARPELRTEPLLLARLKLRLGDLLRGRGEVARARAEYTQAAKALFAFGGDSGQFAHVLMVATLYDRFGLPERSERALGQAMTTFSRDSELATALLAQRSSLALLRGRLESAEWALSAAPSANVPADEQVYLATWLRLLQRAQPSTAATRAERDASERASERVLSPWVGRNVWIARVAEFALGQRSAEQLVAAARSPVERSEAEFYRAWSLELAGDAVAAEQAYRACIAAGGTGLVEYQLALERLAKVATVPPPPELDQLDGTHKAKAPRPANKAPARRGAR